MGVGWGPVAGLVPELEANVGALSGGAQLGRPSVTSSELDPSFPSPHFPARKLRAGAVPAGPLGLPASVLQWAGAGLAQG